MTELSVRASVVSVVALGYVVLALKAGALVAWAEQRQGALIQDRVGPNRAGFLVSGKSMGALSLLFSGVTAAAILYGAHEFEPSPQNRGLEAIVASQSAIFATWFCALIIAGRLRLRAALNAFEQFMKSLGDPRRFVWGGLIVHAVTILAAIVTKGEPNGAFLEEVSHRSGPSVLAFVIVAWGTYSASCLVRAPWVLVRFGGMLQPFANLVKTARKEDIVSANSDRLVHALAPILALFPTLVGLSIVPLSKNLCFGSGWELSPLLQPAASTCVGQMLRLPLVDLDIGVLFWMAVSSVGRVGAALAGWSSNNKFSLLGALRELSQIVSTEAALGLSLVGSMMIFGTMRVDEMVSWQSRNCWGIFVQPVAFGLFLTAAAAATRRVPFDLSIANSELTGGYTTEYSGMKHAMFVIADNLSLVILSAIITSVFLGGFDLPFLEGDGVRVVLGRKVLFEFGLPQIVVFLLGFIVFGGKTLLFCWLLLLVRWTFPRLRGDGLMTLGLTQLLPWALVNVLVTAVVMLLISRVFATADGLLELLCQLSRLAIWVATGIGFVAVTTWMLKPLSHRLRGPASVLRLRSKLSTSKTGTVRT